MNNLIYVTLILGVFDTMACLAAKFWAAGKGSWLFFISIMSFAIAGVFFAYSLKFNPVAIVNVLWIAASVVFVTLFGVFYFKENLSVAQYVGLVLVALGFVLINIKSA